MKIVSHTTLFIDQGTGAKYVAPGMIVDLEDEEAKGLIARGLAIKAPDIKNARNNSKDNSSESYWSIITQ